jgi:hypothetical protein
MGDDRHYILGDFHRIDERAGIQDSRQAQSAPSASARNGPASLQHFRLSPWPRPSAAMLRILAASIALLAVPVHARDDGRYVNSLLV